MQHYLELIILGIIEGITEFLPISSTGHLLIAEKWLPRQSDMFNVVIQCGAVLAVALFYWKHILNMIEDFNKPENKQYLLNLFTTFIVTAFGGFIAKKLGFKLPEEMTPIAIALIVGGIFFLIIEYKFKSHLNNKNINYKIAIILGIAQIVAAIFPGTSRSGAAIIAAMLCGVNRRTATEFSFIVGIPTMFAAGGLQIVHELKNAGAESIQWLDLGLCTLVSGIVAFMSVKWLLGYLQKNSFKIFGWYRIILGLIIIALFK